MTLHEEAKQQVLKNLGEQLTMATENLENIESFDNLISEMTFNQEVDLMVQDITKAYKEESRLGTITPEVHEIIGGLTELVQMLFDKRIQDS